MRIPLLVLLLLLPRFASASWPSDPTTNVPLSIAPGAQQAPQAVSDGKGGAIVAWSDQRGASYDVYMQRVDANGNPRWTQDGVVLCNLANHQLSPAIASDGAGGAIIAWSDNRAGTGYDLYVQRVDSLGAAKWTPNGVAIAIAPNLQYQPRILGDGSGGAILVWTDERNGVGFGRIHVQRVNGSGVPQWTANGVATNNSPAGQNYPRIVTNGADGAIVAWEDVRNGDQDIFAQRILATGALDPAWPIAGRALATFWSAQDLGGLVADGNGGALVSWPQTDFGTSHIFVHHVLSTGALDPAWPGAGRRLYNDFYHQDSPAIVTDSAGGVLVTYLDYHFQPGTREVRAHRVLGSGTVDPAWPDTGLVLCRSTGEKLFPAIVESDTAAIVVWLDQRDGHWDLYAQRFFRTGIVDPDWPIDGRAIATADLDQVNPTLVPDGVGGVILAWEDRRGDNNDGDIYAQSIKGNGQLGDPPVGVPGDAGFDFELRFPNPIRAGAMMVRFTLPGSEGASLEVFDVVGRRVTRLDVGSLGGGPHAVDLAAGWKPVPGVYFVRLSQGPHTNVRRIVLLD